MAIPARGKVALVGAGEYLPTMAVVDKALLEQLEETPRVAVLPTAAVPDGEAVTERWARMGVDYFTQLGAQVEPIMLRTREDANDMTLVSRLAKANFIYMSGGKPGYLLKTLQDTLAWQAMQGIFNSGGVIAGCSAGAMVLGEAIFDFPQVSRTIPALRLVPGIVVVPHFNEIPALFRETIMRMISTLSETTVGIDAATALVWSAAQWTVQGSGGVTLLREKSNQRFVVGEQVPLPGLEQ